MSQGKTAKRKEGQATGLGVTKKESPPATRRLKKRV